MYTNPKVRRLITLVLLLTFGLPTAAPAFGLTADADTSLPACCRRAGAHHCAMSAAEREALTHGTQVSLLTAKCPCCPAPASQLQHLDVAFALNTPSLFSLIAAPTPASQIAAWARAAEAGARHKRGPPAVRLS